MTIKSLTEIKAMNATQYAAYVQQLEASASKKTRIDSGYERTGVVVVPYNKEEHELIATKSLMDLLASFDIEVRVRLGRTQAANKKVYANIADVCFDELADAILE